MKVNWKKILKILAITVLSILLLLVVLFFSLRLPAVQNVLKNQLVSYIEKKVKTDVTLDRFYVDFPNSLVMENLYLKGQTVDTLLFARKFDVGLNIPKLLKNTVDITSIDLAGVRANVVRNADGSFNYDYFVDAFARKDSQESSSKPFIISLDKIKLQDMGVTFIDNQQRNDINLYFKYFDTRVRTFDLDNNTYALNDIVMDGLKLNLKQDLVEEVSGEVEEKVDSLREKKPMKLGLRGIKFTNFNINYGDDNTKTFAKVLFGELSTKVNKLDIEGNSYDIENLLLKDANINAKLDLPNRPATASAGKSQPTAEQKAMRLLLGKASLENVKLVYDNTAIGAKGRGMDFNHLNFSDINLDAEDFKMENGTYSGRVNSAKIKEKNNLDIRRFNTDFAYTDKEAYLKNLYLETSRTILRDELVLNYNSIEQLSANPGAVKINANLKNSRVGFADVLNFMPSLRNTSPFNTYPNAIVNVDARLQGTMSNMLIKTLQISGLGDLKLAASGTLKNATVPEKLLYDLKIANLSASSATVHRLLPKNTIPQTISLPRNFSINGLAKGSTKVFDTNLNIKTTDGNAKIDALVNMLVKNRETYDVKANLQNLNIGKIIQNKDLGIITGNIAAKGQSFDVKNGTANVKGVLAAVDYNGYRYRNMNLAGNLNGGRYKLNLDSRDPNANMKIAASGIYNEKNPTVKVNGNILKLDLQRLGFYKDPMILAGTLDGEFTNLNPDFLNGYLNLEDFSMSDTKEIYPVQQLSLRAVSTSTSNSLTLNSQIADLEMSGKYRLTQIFTALQNTVNSYYRFQTPAARKSVTPGQHFTFTAAIKNDDLIRKFVPELKSFETVNLSGNYDADSQNLNVDGTIPQLTYGANQVENGVLKVFTQNNSIQYSLNVDKVSSEKFALNKAAVTGDVANNVIRYTISTRDGKDVEQFLIAGNATSANGMNIISLNPDGLKLNYTNWQVAPDNQLQFGKRGILANNFVLSNGGSQIAINSETNVPNSPLNIDFKDFQIETITEMVKKDSLLAKGTINGNVKLKDFQKNLNFTSDLNVTGFQMYNNPIGDISAKVNSKTANLLYADIALTGFDNDVKITGDYNISNQNLDLVMDMNRLQMKSVQGFTMNAITDSEGYLSGRLGINGTTSSPKILGKIKFNDAGLQITQTGSDFRHINDEIDFTSQGIAFNSFKINDKDGNALTIDGLVRTSDYKDFAFDLDVKARDFKVVDAEVDNEKMMYGTLAIDADLNIGGNLDLPKVDGRLAVQDNTNFTFVVPQSTPTMQDREGIVEFIDQDKMALQGTLKKDTLTSQTDVKGMDVNVSISLTKEAKISLVIDKSAGDFVELQGTAELTGGIDPSGKTTLVGVYEVDQGAYEMTLSLLKRKFVIQKGSTITWTGEPTAATLDMIAVYNTNAAPIDLVQQQLTGQSPSELNRFKQRIPFNTLLKLNGELLKPVITFDITTDDENTSVATEVLDLTKDRLDQLRNDEAELNKQVFALLLLNRFVGENPFQSESGMSAGTMARQSVSQILSQQLNNLAGDLIEGVDLSFDFNSYDDYTAGQKNTRTDLDVTLSKRLLNDRLKVSVGNNFGIEGDARQNEKMTNIAGDITVDYSLSKDGRYMLRAYRKNEYQVALQGQIIETGVGFIITLDYDKFRDIFRKAEEKRRKKDNR